MTYFTFFASKLKESKTYRYNYTDSLKGAAGSALLGNGLGGLLTLFSLSSQASKQEQIFFVTSAGLVMFGVNTWLASHFILPMYEHFHGRDPLGKLTNAEFAALEKWYQANCTEENFEQKFINTILKVPFNFGTEEYTLQQASKHLDDAYEAQGLIV